ncbi:MAG: ABC transporter substrate-binding protein [Streptosporangiales bacterium]|nr:ABC transporter substrate-binding protein [Streptosporangiales bacterium]
MAIQSTVRLAAVVAAVALGAAAACGGGGGGDEQQAGAKGGTLTLLQTDDFEHLDPARNYVTNSGDFGQRLLTRALTQYKAAPGEAGQDLMPDLAVDTGQANEDKTVWTFKLREGLKYEDGSPITAQDVKYGVERAFSADLPEGPPWPRQLIEGGDDYKGPYEDKGGLDSIETPDDRTIVFNLKRPVPYFNYTVTFPVFGPVPEDKDNGVKYDNRPFSSGPYKIEKYDRGKELVLVRNEHWDPKTDPVRKARPDRIVVKMGIDPTTIDQRLIADQGEDQTAINIEDVEPSSIARIVNDPKVKERFIQGGSPCTRWIGLNMSHKPLDNLKVRQAINYAVSQESYITSRGGPVLADPTSTIMPPSLPGYQKFNLYPNNNFKGDPEKAKQMLADAGYPDGLELTLTSTTESGAYGPDQAEAIQQALAKAGIKVKINAVSASVYYTEIGNIKRQDDLVFYGWCAEWPSAETMIPPTFDGAFIKPQGNNNTSQYDDPEANKRVAEILELMISDPQAADRAWGQLDRQIMQDAPIVPLSYDLRSQLIGSKVTGAFGAQMFGGHVDLATVGVEQ